MFSGRHLRRRGVDLARAEEVRIEATQPFTLYADGEPIAELPISIRTLPGAVRMIVPR